MSTFLAWDAALISPGYTTTSLQNTFAGLLSTAGWQILRKAVLPTSVVGTFTNPTYALDMLASTAASGTIPMYVGCNIATGFTPTVMYVQAEWASGPNYSPLTFTLDYSSNGSSWTTLQTFTGQANWSYGERRKFTITGATSQTYWRINVTAVGSGTTCYLGEWCLEDASGNWLTQQNFFDCIPPVTETIGNSYTRDVLRWLIPSAGTSITIRPVQELLTPLPQMNNFYSATAGAVTVSITINSNTVSYTGTAGNTSIQNLRFLYEACKNSVNVNFTAWTWVWNSNLTATSAMAGFFCIQNTPAMNVTITGSNLTVAQRSTSVYQVPQVQSGFFAGLQTATIDAVNGFIYYLQICSRGIALGIKNGSGYQTPIHCCYGDNASTIAQIPVSELAQYGLPCTPIELFCGTDNAVANTDGGAWPTHFWGVANGSNNAVQAPDYGPSQAGACNPFSKHFIQGIFQDLCTYTYFNNVSVEMSGEGFFQGADSGTAFSIHRLGTTPGIQWTYMSNYNNNYYARFTGPNYVNLDWYKYTGTAPSNEQLLISCSNDFTAAVTVLGTNAATSVTVNSTAGFPTSGFIVINGEIMSYSNTTTTSFTGLVRGLYNTMTTSPQIGDTVYIGAWFMFMSPGLLFCGYQIPT